MPFNTGKLSKNSLDSKKRDSKTDFSRLDSSPYNLPVAYRTTFDTFASLITLHGGRPHWAKTHTLTPSILEQTYPRFRDFMKVRERVDPQGVLVNGYVRRHLLGQDENGGKISDEGERWDERSREWKVRKGVRGSKQVEVPKQAVQSVC